MKKTKKIILYRMLTALMSLLVFNCSLSDLPDTQNTPIPGPTPTARPLLEPPRALMGYWQSMFGDGFEIMESEQIRDTFLYIQYDDSSKTASFTGIIVNINSEEDGTGYITVKITDSGTWGKTVDEYYVIHYKDLSGNYIKESCAYKIDGYSTMSSREAAEAEFTVANDYFAFYGEYTWQ